MSLKAVILDFGGVLVRTRSEHRRLAWEQRLGLPPGRASDLLWGGERGLAMELGRRSSAAQWRWIGETLGLDEEMLASFRADFFAEDELDVGLTAYVDRLRGAGYHAGLLSNFGDDARQVFGDVYGILDRFDSVTISSEEGVMKPDARIYRIALARAGVRPAEAVFVDDIEANAAGARAVGLAAVHFRDPDQAMRELRGLTGVA